MTIQSLSKPRKTKSKKVSYWSGKADKLMQEIGREIYADDGGILGGEYSCLHHFYPKSQSTFLRYNWLNLIPIANGDHMQHHNGNPEIHINIIKIKGEEWFKSLQALRNQNRYVNAGYTYYREKYYELFKILEKLQNNRAKTIKELLEPYHVK